MKKLNVQLIASIALILLGSARLWAQTTEVHYATREDNIGINSHNVNRVSIPMNGTTTFVSPEPIQYVDISTDYAHGELSEPNLFRLKVNKDHFEKGDSFEVTLVTASYVAVYELYPKTDEVAYVITVNPNDAVQVDQYDALTQRQCFNLALLALSKKRSIKNMEAKAYGLEVQVNNIFIVGDYLLFDISAKNSFRLQFDVDQIRFKIIDKRLLKATVSQDIALKPVYQLYPDEGAIIRKKWRNFYILKKFTYPSEKYLDIEITENQISGRKIDLKIDYKQILRARTLM